MQSGTPLLRTMIVDDSPTFMRTVCSFLNHIHAVEIVATAENAPDALALAEKIHPDLVLMDMQMPRMNGLEATVQFHKRFPGIKIIMVTGHDTPELRRASRESGAQGFVSKNRFAQELPTRLKEIAMMNGSAA
jgi:DNA-binding NarL/FixJ family response regulator